MSSSLDVELSENMTYFLWLRSTEYFRYRRVSVVFAGLVPQIPILQNLSFYKQKRTMKEFAAKKS